MLSLGIRNKKFPVPDISMSLPSKHVVKRLSLADFREQGLVVGAPLTGSSKRSVPSSRCAVAAGLKLPIAGIRPNILNVYRLCCQAKKREFPVNGVQES
jgi:hypothetical protein